MTLTLTDLHEVWASAPDWTRVARVFRMSDDTARALTQNAGWALIRAKTIWGYPLVIDNSVPIGTIHFEIPVPEPPRGIEKDERTPHLAQRLLGVVADPFPRS